MRATIAAILSAGNSSVSGIPETEAWRTSGIIASPWLPITKPVTSLTETFNSSAMNTRKRAESRQPPIPKTRSRGKPKICFAYTAITSIGLQTTITIEFGANFLTPSQTSLTIFALMPTSSSRLMPGLRGIPAVMITTSESAMSSYLLVPLIFVSNISIGLACARSKALPIAEPSLISRITTSPNSF
ncbi:hypothetical protein D3C87_1039640 [compost metagenome]